MAKNVMKAFDEFYTEAFGQSEAILTSLENGAQISDEVRVRTLMGGLKKFSDRVLDNVKADQKRDFKSAVKDYSNYYKLKESSIDYSIVDNNRLERKSGKTL